MPAPDMRELVQSMVGETVRTVARDRPNRIVSVSGNQVLVETETGRNPASLRLLQNLADRVYQGEEVVVPLRGRSAFYMAMLATLPRTDFALNPRRVWLEDPPGAFDAEYGQLFPDEAPAAAQEGRVLHRQHRLRERSRVLCEMRKDRALNALGKLECEVCGFEFAQRYGALGERYIECHHTIPLAASDERETAIEDLALLCANCHRMIHRSRLTLSVDELRQLVQGESGRC